jgi:hypothetical protein
MRIGLPGPGEVQVGCVAEAVAVTGAHTAISANTTTARRLLTDTLSTAEYGLPTII